MSLQKLATMVASFTALILLLTKFFVWIMSWSIAVLSSAIDSLLDLCVSLFNYFAVHNAEKKADSLFNYGRGKIEALASLLEWLIISGSGIFIIYTAVLKIIYKEEIAYIWVALGVMVFSVAITGGLVYFLEHVAKKTKSLVIQSDALHYKTDLYSNMWILFSLWIIYFTSWYLVDAIVGIIIGIYIIYSAWELIRKGYLLLLDAALSDTQVEQIKKIIKKQALITSFHELKTRASGHTNFVEVHLVFTPDIKLIDAHRISDHIEFTIPKIDADSDWKVMIHMDPYDDSLVDRNFEN